MSANEIAAAFAGLSAAAAVVTTVVAVRSLGVTAKDSRDRSRPVLVASLRNSTLGKGTQDLFIKNYGATAARGVTVLFDPPLDDTGDTSKNVHWIGQRYNERIAVWPAGLVLRNVYRHPQEDPGRRTVVIAYQGLSRKDRFTDRFIIDPKVVSTETTSNPSFQENKQWKILLETLGAIARSLDDK